VALPMRSNTPSRLTSHSLLTVLPAPAQNIFDGLNHIPFGAAVDFLRGAQQSR
jgi:hypothetical protein